MKKVFRKAFILSACIAVVSSLASCSDDNNGDDTTPSNDNPNKCETPVTPEEQKAFVEQTAIELKKALKPEDQADFVNFCTAFANEFSSFNDDDYDEPYYVNRGIRHLGEAMRHGNAFGVTRAMQEISYGFSDITGIYEPDFDNDEWVRTGKSDKVEFRFTVNGQKSTLTITGNGGTWSGQGEGYTYDDDDYYDENPIPVLYKLTVPKNVKITLVHGTKTLAEATVKTNYDQKDHKATADVNATVANINFKSTADVNDSRALGQVVVSVGGTEIANVNGQLNGHDLCNFDRLLEIWEASENDDYDDEDSSWINNSNNIHNLFTNATASVNLLRRMYFTGKCDSMSRLAYIFSNWYDVEEDKAAAQQQLGVINEHILSQFYLGGSKEPTGDIVWTLSKETDDAYDDYTYWYAEPVLKFRSDNTTYRFSEYFNESSSTLEVLAGIADMYKAFFGF